MQSVFDLPANTWEYGQRHRSIQIYRSRQGHKIMKRSAKRLIASDSLLGANGIYTMLVDKPMKLMSLQPVRFTKAAARASEKNKDESYSSASDRERIGRRQSREKRARAMVCQRDSATQLCNREGLYNLPTFFYFINTSFIFFLLLLWLLLLFYYTVYLFIINNNTFLLPI